MIAPKRMKEYEAHILELCSQPSGRGTTELIGLFEAFKNMPLSHGITHDLHQLRKFAEANWRLNADFPIPEINRNYNDFTTKLYDNPSLTLDRLVEMSTRKIAEEKARQVEIPTLIAAP